MTIPTTNQANRTAPVASRQHQPPTPARRGYAPLGRRRVIGCHHCQEFPGRTTLHVAGLCVILADDLKSQAVTIDGVAFRPCSFVVNGRLRWLWVRMDLFALDDDEVIPLFHAWTIGQGFSGGQNVHPNAFEKSGQNVQSSPSAEPFRGGANAMDGGTAPRPAPVVLDFNLPSGRVADSARAAEPVEKIPQVLRPRENTHSGPPVQEKIPEQTPRPSSAGKRSPPPAWF